MVKVVVVVNKVVAVAVVVVVGAGFLREGWQGSIGLPVTVATRP